MNAIAGEIIPPAKRRNNSEPVFFFDFFPSEILDNLVKNISDIPNAKNWHSHIGLRDLVELLGVRGCLGIFLKSRFDTLHVSKSLGWFHEEVVRGWELLHDPYLWTDDVDVALAYVRAGGDESLCTLVVSPEICEEERVREHITDEFLRHCSYITSLTIEEIGPSWTKTFRSQLQKLECAVPPRFVMNFVAFRELNLSAYTGDRNSIDFWKSLGLTLEQLGIDEYCPTDNDAEIIRKYCPNVRNICLEGADKFYEATRLLTSYGNRLEYGHARFYLNSHHDLLSALVLSIIGPRQEGIRLPEFVMSGDLVAWTNAWNKCTILQEVYIEPGKVEDIEVIFSKPKEHLKELRIWFCRGIDAQDVKKMMTICASGTKCLVTLKCN